MCVIRIARRCHRKSFTALAQLMKEQDEAAGKRCLRELTQSCIAPASSGATVKTVAPLFSDSMSDLCHKRSVFVRGRSGGHCVKGSVCKNYDELPLFLNTETGATGKSQRRGLCAERSGSRITKPRGLRRGEGYGACDDETKVLAERQRITKLLAEREFPA